MEGKEADATQPPLSIYTVKDPPVKGMVPPTAGRLPTSINVVSQYDPHKQAKRPGSQLSLDLVNKPPILTTTLFKDSLQGTITKQYNAMSTYTQCYQLWENILGTVV